MRKYLVAAALSLWMVLFAFVSPASAETTCSNTTLGTVCAIVTGSHLRVTLLGNTVIDTTIPQTIVNVPGPTVTLPRVTVTVPPVNSVVTRTSTVTVTVTPTGQNGRSSATITSSTPTGQSTGNQSSASPTTRVVHQKSPQRTVTITRAKAFALSLLFIILGLLLAFLIMLLYYYLGWKGKEREDKKFFDSLRDDVLRITKG